MEQLEKVEKLRERADVSYEEAKEALEACDWDLLDAMVWLEKRGKVKGPDKRELYHQLRGTGSVCLCKRQGAGTGRERKRQLF